MPTTQYRFIDMHTHLFTARYLPLQGIFMGFTKGKFPRLCRGLAKIIYRITGESRFSPASPEPGLQRQLADAILNRDADAMLSFVTGPMRRLLNRLPTESFIQLEQPDDVQDMLEALDDIRADLAGAAQTPSATELRDLGIERPQEHSIFETPSNEPDELDRLLYEALITVGDALKEADFLEAVVHLHIDGPFAANTDRGLNKVALDGSQLGSLRQILLFIMVMAMSERTRFRLLERDYEKGKAPDGHDAEHYVGVLMDMTGAYDSHFERKLLPPPVPFRAQIDRMNALSKEQGGRLISFAAVDPFREDWRDLVDHGVANGARGFKLYCPLGVRPTESSVITPVNPDSKYREYRDAAISPVPDQSAQARMEAILHHFASNELRLYSHCTPIGFQVKTGFGVFGDPELWGKAMTQYNAKDLWLFLAHGGGATGVDLGGWDIKEDDGDDPDRTFFAKTFAGRAIRLAEKSENVYLGSAFYEGIDSHTHGHGDLNRIQKRMKRILTSTRSNTKSHISERLCFGTDWSMPMAIGRTRELLHNYYEFFEDPELEGIAPFFFRENARRFIGLDAEWPST